MVNDHVRKQYDAIYWIEYSVSSARGRLTITYAQCSAGITSLNSTNEASSVLHGDENLQRCHGIILISYNDSINDNSDEVAYGITLCNDIIILMVGCSILAQSDITEASKVITSNFESGIKLTNGIIEEYDDIRLYCISDYGLLNFVCSVRKWFGFTEHSLLSDD